MKLGILVAPIVLVGVAAAAEQTQPATERGYALVSGKDNPDAIPDWSALDSILGMALRSNNGKELLKSLTSVSDAGALALIEYRRAQEAAMRTADAQRWVEHRAALCNNPTTKDEVIAKRDRLAQEHQARRKASVEGAYSVLGPEDAEKLRTAVRASRKNVTSFGVTDATKAYDNTVRGGLGFSDTGISGFRSGHQRDRRSEVHEEAQT